MLILARGFHHRIVHRFFVAVFDQVGAESFIIIFETDARHAVAGFIRNFIAIDDVVGAFVEVKDPGFEDAGPLFSSHWFPGAAMIVRNTPAARRRLMDLGLLETARLGEKFTIRSANPLKVLRFAWVEGQGDVEVRFTAKGPSNSQVAIDHQKLASAKAA